MDNKQFGLLTMRITSGLFFLAFGAMKFMGLSGFADKYLGMFGGAAMFVAFLVAAGEAVAGLALLSGYYMKWASYLLAVIMLGSIFIAHNFFMDPSQMMTGLVRVVLIGYYIGLAQLLPNKCVFSKKEI
jgi:uncharacterized membrane protein YphA (DoxX/SURF4 family)